MGSKTKLWTRLPGPEIPHIRAWLCVTRLRGVHTWMQCAKESEQFSAQSMSDKTPPQWREACRGGRKEKKEESQRWRLRSRRPLCPPLTLQDSTDCSSTSMGLASGMFCSLCSCQNHTVHSVAQAGLLPAPPTIGAPTPWVDIASA